MTAGTIALESGSMAEAIYDELVAELGDPGDASDTYAGIAAAIANAVVDHIAANADVTITTGDNALQRDPSTFSSTEGPASDRTLEGAIS